jgi:hypothetical protein
MSERESAFWWLASEAWLRSMQEVERLDKKIKESV